MLLAAAAACAMWHGQVTGYYDGRVVSDGEKSIETWLEVAPTGLLAGRYVLHEATRDVTGTLEAVGDEGCHTAIFRWTDVYGTGLARLTFDPERKCFDGAWGGNTIVPELVWHSCTPQRVTS